MPRGKGKRQSVRPRSRDNVPHVTVRIACNRGHRSHVVAKFSVPEDPQRRAQDLRGNIIESDGSLPNHASPMLAMQGMTQDPTIENRVSRVEGYRHPVAKVRWRCALCGLDVTLTSEHADRLVDSAVTAGVLLLDLYGLACTIGDSE